MKSIIKRGILGIAQRSALVTRLAEVITQHSVEQTKNRDASPMRDSYAYLRQAFIANGDHHAINRSRREELVANFERIHSSVPMGSTPTDGLILAEMLLNLEAPGDLIECGCYAGGSSAKLSLVAKLLGRKLVIFDSFEGLPAVDQYFLRDQHCRRNDEWVTDWTKGRYAARIDEVRHNIEQYGDLSVCSFIKGWFSETLTPDNLPDELAFAFTDVDLANSARDCFTALWPILSNGGIYVTHDTAYIKVLLEMYNPVLWREQFKSIPPILFGAGFGICNESPHIGYMVKGESPSPDYLKSLTIDK